MDSTLSGKKMYIPVVIAAGVCLFLIRSNFLAFFFLVPLGFISYRYDYRTAWTTSFCVILGNLMLTLGLLISQGLLVTETVWNVLFVSAMLVIFTLITSPSPEIAGRFSGMLRLMAGSCFGAVLFTGIFFRISSSPGFLEYFDYLFQSMISTYSSTASDVVQNARMEMLTAEGVLQGIKMVLLRGGGLVSCVLLFVVSHQISYLLAWLFSLKEKRRGWRTSSLILFHVHPALIWVFSSSLLLVVLTRTTGLEIPEIILWNLLIFCAMLYFAQGLGICQFFLTRPSLSPFLRLLLGVAFIVMLFSPFLNMLLLGALVLLGAVENWVPFRAPQKNGPSSTPEDRSKDL